MYAVFAKTMKLNILEYASFLKPPKLVPTKINEFTVILIGVTLPPRLSMCYSTITVNSEICVCVHLIDSEI